MRQGRTSVNADRFMNRTRIKLPSIDPPRLGLGTGCSRRHQPLTRRRNWDLWVQVQQPSGHGTSSVTEQNNVNRPKQEILPDGKSGNRQAIHSDPTASLQSRKKNQNSNSRRKVPEQAKTQCQLGRYVSGNKPPLVHNCASASALQTQAAVNCSHEPRQIRNREGNSEVNNGRNSARNPASNIPSFRPVSPTQTVTPEKTRGDHITLSSGKFVPQRQIIGKEYDHSRCDPKVIHSTTLSRSIKSHRKCRSCDDLVTATTGSEEYCPDDPGVQNMSRIYHPDLENQLRHVYSNADRASRQAKIKSHKDCLHCAKISFRYGHQSMQKGLPKDGSNEHLSGHSHTSALVQSDEKHDKMAQTTCDKTIHSTPNSSQESPQAKYVRPYGSVSLSPAPSRSVCSMPRTERNILFLEKSPTKRSVLRTFDENKPTLQSFSIPGTTQQNRLQGGDLKERCKSSEHRGRPVSKPVAGDSMTYGTETCVTGITSTADTESSISKTYSENFIQQNHPLKTDHTGPRDSQRRQRVQKGQTNIRYSDAQASSPAIKASVESNRHHPSTFHRPDLDAQKDRGPQRRSQSVDKSHNIPTYGLPTASSRRKQYQMYQPYFGLPQSDKRLLPAFSGMHFPTGDCHSSPKYDLSPGTPAAELIDRCQHSDSNVLSTPDKATKQKGQSSFRSDVPRTACSERKPFLQSNGYQSSISGPGLDAQGEGRHYRRCQSEGRSQTSTYDPPTAKPKRTPFDVDEKNNKEPDWRSNNEGRSRPLTPSPIKSRVSEVSNVNTSNKTTDFRLCDKDYGHVHSTNPSNYKSSTLQRPHKSHDLSGKRECITGNITTPVTEKDYCKTRNPLDQNQMYQPCLGLPQLDKKLLPETSGLYLPTADSHASLNNGLSPGMPAAELIDRVKQSDSNALSTSERLVERKGQPSFRPNNPNTASSERRPFVRSNEQQVSPISKSEMDAPREGRPNRRFQSNYRSHTTSRASKKRRNSRYNNRPDLRSSTVSSKQMKITDENAAPITKGSIFKTNSEEFSQENHLPRTNNTGPQGSHVSKHDDFVNSNASTTDRFAQAQQHCDVCGCLAPGGVNMQPWITKRFPGSRLKDAREAHIETTVPSQFDKNHQYWKVMSESDAKRKSQSQSTSHYDNTTPYDLSGSRASEMSSRNTSDNNVYFEIPPRPNIVPLTRNPDNYFMDHMGQRKPKKEASNSAASDATRRTGRDATYDAFSTSHDAGFSLLRKEIDGQRYTDANVSSIPVQNVPPQQPSKSTDEANIFPSPTRNVPNTFFPLKHASSVSSLLTESTSGFETGISRQPSMEDLLQESGNTGRYQIVNNNYYFDQRKKKKNITVNKPRAVGINSSMTSYDGFADDETESTETESSDDYEDDDKTTYM